MYFRLKKGQILTLIWKQNTRTKTCLGLIWSAYLKKEDRLITVTFNM